MSMVIPSVWVTALEQESPCFLYQTILGFLCKDASNDAIEILTAVGSRTSTEAIHATQKTMSVPKPHHQKGFIFIIN